MRKIRKKKQWDTREILQAQIEVQDTLLQQISKDLHDHIGQLLSVAQISLTMVNHIGDDNTDQTYVNQACDLITESINELRVMAKNIESDFVKDFRMVDRLSTELRRIQKTTKLATELTIAGEKFTLGFEKEILLFRISQVILEIIIKYPQITRIQVFLRYGTSLLTVVISAVRTGHDDQLSEDQLTEAFRSNSVVIEQRADILGGEFSFYSKSDRITAEISIPLNRALKRS